MGVIRNMSVSRFAGFWMDPTPEKDKFGNGHRIFFDRHDTHDGFYSITWWDFCRTQSVYPLPGSLYDYCDYSFDIQKNCFKAGVAIFFQGNFETSGIAIGRFTDQCRLCLSYSSAESGLG